MRASMASIQLLPFRPPTPFSSSSLLLKPLSLSFIINQHKPLSTPPPRFFCNSSSSSSSSGSLTYSHTPSPSLLLEPNSNDPKHEFQLQQQQDEKLVEAVTETPIQAPSVNNAAAVKLPTLSIKEKKELASYANSLGKKLKIQQVGKSGVTESVAAAFVENLESNELLKLKIMNSCPGELPDVIKQLEVTTGSVAVGQIGRSVILYRPSLSKLKAEEKKREGRRVFERKGFRPKPTELRLKSDELKNKLAERRAAAPRLSGRGRRGRSRSELP